ncbi:MAG: TIGR04141 family sporadically distributed protein [Bryobacterales bacterium]|nr:TIGR04141 family sporadically distributed protein [Bryobacterales bacterium]
MSNTQKLSVRLLQKGLTPPTAVREGVELAEWPKLDGALISLDTLGGGPPKWTRFLELSDDEKKRVFNHTAFGLVFVPSAGRWFAVAFGMGHVKLDPAAFEQDFGLRVVLNAVDPQQLKSADVRTPDENTLSRRTQTSRGSDQTAFAIDVERDLVRGLAGKPKDGGFGSYVAGTDGLTLSRRLDVNELPTVCAEAYAIFQKKDYQLDFGWVDKIRHIRSQTVIEALDSKLIAALSIAIRHGSTDTIHLAFPVIYDPERPSVIRYKGFRSWELYPDLDIGGYLHALRERSKFSYQIEDLEVHAVHEVDGEGRDCGGKWKLRDCIVFETDLNGSSYVLSGGRWYQIDQDLAKEVQDFFDKAPRVELPPAEADETEESYNKRVAGLDAQMICLDRRLIKPSGAATTIEACDFLSRERHLIHVKDKTSSSRLSHLFNQGTVSARVLAIDPPARDSVRAKVEIVQRETGQTGYETIVPRANEEFRRSAFTVVYAVIASGEKPRLPFFSLVSFRQAARELDALGYQYAFAWIEKPKVASKGKAKRGARVAVAELEVAA